MIWPLLVMACGPKEVPPHLRVEESNDGAVEIEVVDDRSALARLLGRDPLARRADPLTPGAWADLPSGEALEDWASLARQDESTPTDWQALESRWPGTMVVGLARGSQLGRMQVQLAGEGDRSLSAAAVSWLGPLRAGEELYPREPAAWISEDPHSRREDLLYLAERRVLLGWLHAPTVPVAPVATAIDPAIQGRLVASPAGRILLARAGGERDAETGQAGERLLERATTLALEEAAADADGEQRAWREHLLALRAELGVDDPLAALLAQARVALIADAGTPSSAGLALVAATAERVRGTCPDAPCTGLDRTSTLASAGRWGPEVSASAAAWRLISLKSAVDAFEASWDHPSFKTHAPLLVDALLGTGAASMDLGVLRVQAATPGTFLAIGRGTGRDGITGQQEARRALRDHLVRIADEALVTDLTEEQRSFAQRIRRRAEG